MSTKGDFDILQPDQVEIQLQYDRVLRILDLVIEKAKICIRLRDFLSQPSKLLDLDVECDRLPVAVNSGRKQVSRQDSLKRFIEPQMTQVVEILYKNDQLKKAALEDCHLSSDESTRFISCLKLMRDIMEKRSKVEAVEQIMHGKFLTRAYRENIEMKGHLLAITSEGDKQRRKFQMQINSQNATLSALQYEIALRSAAVKEETKLITEKNEAGLAEDRVTSKLRQQELSADAKTLINQYESLLAQHLKSEGKLRAKRLKTEVQLSGWLSKYDSDMQDRQTEFDFELSGFEEERDAYHLLVFKLNELEEVSVSLMEEKKEEDEMQRRAVNFFARNRAARIIQRYYRAYRLRVTKSKKNDKKKKKNKK